MRIAILMACFNRRKMTEKCLESLKNQMKGEKDIIFDVFLYDDGSSDGTLEAARNIFPEIIAARGQGNSYWCKGMFVLMQKAAALKYDFYLMVNDDVQFYADAIRTMLNSYAQKRGSHCVVGTTRSSRTKLPTYGGRNREGVLIVPEKELRRCSLANWNCFLIDSETIEKVGIIDGKYQHSWGDYDYSIRAEKSGVPIYIADHYVGECESNSVEGTFKDSNVPKKERFKKLFSPKGMPFYSYMRYNFRLNGIVGWGQGIYGYGSILYYILTGREIR